MKKFNINTIALEDSTVIQKGKNLKFAGASVILTGFILMLVSEVITNKGSLKIHAVNNEAADLIENLDDNWLMQNKN